MDSKDKNQIYELSQSVETNQEKEIKNKGVKNNASTEKQPSATDSSNDSVSEIYGIAESEPIERPVVRSFSDSLESEQNSTAHTGFDHSDSFHSVSSQTPVSSPASASFRTSSDRWASEITEGKKTSKNRLSDEDFGEEAASLSDIYERKRRQRLEEEMDGEDPDHPELDQRQELPLHPFFDRIFRPLLTPGFLLRILIMLAIGFIPFYLGTYFFDRYADHLAQAHPEELSRQSAKFWTLLRSFFVDDRVILFSLTFGWGIILIPFSIHIFGATANGDDTLEEWPEYSVLGGLGQILWLALLIVLGGLPGVFLISLLRFFGITGGTQSENGFFLSAFFFAPVFFLSSMESDMLFTPLTKKIRLSFKAVKREWILFYLLSAGLIILGSIVIGIIAFLLYRMPDSFLLDLFLAGCLCLTFTLLPIVYLRLLGRLAWVIDEKTILLETSKSLISQDSSDDSDWEIESLDDDLDDSELSDSLKRNSKKL